MRSPLAHLRAVRRPAAYHGDGVRGGYFEGWYVRLVSADLVHRWALIPGVFRSSVPGGVDEAFVQVIDGSTGRTAYHRFAVDEFRASASEFRVSIGPNHFDSTGVRLDLPGIRGCVEYADPMDGYPVTWRTPGIMGWYGYLPIMECQHAVVSFGHALTRSLSIDDVEVSFDGGRGYIEKDWGRSFPSAYIWTSSNHLRDRDADIVDGSLMASSAIIPGLGRSFRGSIVALKRGDALATWASWNGSSDDELVVDDQHVRWWMSGPHGTLRLLAERTRGGLLHAPLRTAMHRRVEESMDARVHIQHTSPDGETLFSGTGECAGLEVFGPTEDLVRLRGRRTGASMTARRAR